MQRREPIDPNTFGVSFSLKQCRSFGIDAAQTLEWLIEDAGFRRFRLMSYWNEHEKRQGEYNFTELDAQIKQLEAAGCVFSLSLGARQPRWPENHWPRWAWEASYTGRTEALLKYIEEVVARYKDSPALISYQLENEALLANFGVNSEISRTRLRQEYQLIKKLDPSKPVIMSTSNAWGIPLRRPIPDIVGFSLYYVMYRKGAYRRSTFYPWFHRFRKTMVLLLLRKPTFIHELQCEPWGPTAIWKMTTGQQNESMPPARIAENVRLAKLVNAPPIDLWGGEWWYWRSIKDKNTAIIDAVVDAIHCKS